MAVKETKFLKKFKALSKSSFYDGDAIAGKVNIELFTEVYEPYMNDQSMFFENASRNAVPVAI